MAIIAKEYRVTLVSPDGTDECEPSTHAENVRLTAAGWQPKPAERSPEFKAEHEKQSASGLKSWLPGGKGDDSDDASDTD